MQVDGRIDEKSSSFEIFLYELESNSIKLCNCELFTFIMITTAATLERKFRRGKKIVAMFETYLCVTLVKGRRVPSIVTTRDQGKKLSVE